MQIHTVKRGQTVFHIARNYQTSPVKIIENNGLVRPDALMAGEELLICMPSRSYTVRGTETLGEIAERFSVKKSDLLRYNPELHGTDALRPSMSLAIKYGSAEYGTASSLGFVRQETPIEAIREALPYLSYFVFDGAISNGEEIQYKDEHSEGVRLVRREKKIPLLRIAGREIKECFYQSQATKEALIRRMIDLSLRFGFYGIVMPPDIFSLPSRREKDAFLLQLRKQMLGSDLILFCECNGLGEFGDFADANIILPSYLIEKGDYDNEQKIQHASEFYETQKTFLGLPTYALDNEMVISKQRMREIAYQTKKEYHHSDDEVYFDYTRYASGKREQRRVSAMSLAGLKRMFAYMSEYGFMGCAVEVDYFVPQAKMMLALLFCGVEYAFGFS
ncbi:MAG: LysM peptidoglycan-binding domain-containing protein [Clostridia bacterium]|nr:LysM peptidoglycan-binding domain-containing protein [Clostridia bacterium]